MADPMATTTESSPVSAPGNPLARAKLGEEYMWLLRNNPYQQAFRTQSMQQNLGRDINREFSPNQSIETLLRMSPYGGSPELINRLMSRMRTLGAQTYIDTSNQFKENESMEAQKTLLTALQESMQPENYQTRQKGSEGGQAMLAGGAAIGTAALLMCWVARAVYGVRDSRWLRFRLWLLTRASDELREFYINNGMKIAESIKKDSKLKRKFRKLMDKILEGRE